VSPALVYCEKNLKKSLEWLISVVSQAGSGVVAQLEEVAETEANAAEDQQADDDDEEDEVDLGDESDDEVSNALFICLTFLCGPSGY